MKGNRKINRREFVKKASTTTGVMVMLPPISLSGSKSLKAVVVDDFQRSDSLYHGI